MSSARPPWSSDRVHATARDARRRLHELDVIRRKGPRTVLRYPVDGGTTVIVKLWETDSWRSRAACLLRTWSVDHEWRGLVRAGSLGVRAPEPLGIARSTWAPGVHGGAIVMEDLGERPSAMEFVQRCLARGDAVGLERFENSIVEMTARMLDGGLLDDDHGLLNMVASDSGEAIRLDFERARNVRWPGLRPGLVARTIGRTIATYSFAVDADGARIDTFTERMRRRVRGRDGVWRSALRYVESEIRAQLEDRARKERAAAQS